MVLEQMAWIGKAQAELGEAYSRVEADLTMDDITNLVPRPRMDMSNPGMACAKVEAQSSGVNTLNISVTRSSTTRTWTCRLT